MSAEPTFDKQMIEEIVLQAIRDVNLARDPADQAVESTDAALYGEGSRLDSLGLVALLIDVEESLRDRGIEVSLSDDRAMSQSQSPFRSVPTLVAYIQEEMKRASK